MDGALQLADQTPVPGALVDIICGAVHLSVRTDHDGRFKVHSLPAGKCRFVAELAAIDQTLTVKANPARSLQPVRLVVPRRTRVTLAGAGQTHVLDSRLLPLAVADGALIWLGGGGLSVFRPRCMKCAPTRHEIEVGARIWIEGMDARSGKLLTISAVERRVELPPALRPPPRQGEIFSTSLFTQQGQPARIEPAERQLLLTSRCDHIDYGFFDKLERFATRHLSSGLKVSVLFISERTPTLGRLGNECPPVATTRVIPRNPEYLEKERTVDRHAVMGCVWQGGSRVMRDNIGFYLGGEEAAWAIGATRDRLDVIDRRGRSLFRTALVGDGSSLHKVTTFLTRTWSTFTVQ